jgi:hypothetical protein
VQLWNPFFNLVQFVIGVCTSLFPFLSRPLTSTSPQTFFSYRLKQLQVAAKRAKRAEDEADKS